MLNVLTDALFVSALAGALALLVAALRPLLARRYTARLRCALWWALALWLCLPFKPTLPHAPVQLTVPQAAMMHLTFLESRKATSCRAYCRMVSGLRLP